MIRVPPVMLAKYHGYAQDKPRLNLQVITPCGWLTRRVLSTRLWRRLPETIRRCSGNRARCDGNWHVAAMRLKGLAASFNAEPLLPLTEEAIEAAPGDPVVVRKIQAFLDEFSAA
jgi:hypothetical protein